MRTVDSLPAQPASTADRVAAAWADAHPLLRGTAIAAGATAAALSTAVPAPQSVRWGIVAVGAVLAAAATVDVAEHKLPNRLLVAALALAYTSVLAAADWALMVSAVSGLVIAGGLMLLVRLTRGIGMGDVKMAAVVGASVGAVNVRAAPIAIAVAALAAATYGFLSHRTRLPLGPALWLGWGVSLAASAAGWLS